METRDAAPESHIVDTSVDTQAVAQAREDAGSRRMLMGMALLAVLLAAAILLPAYGSRPLPGMERDQPALLLPTPLLLLAWFPWLEDMDRRLAAFGGAALFCTLLALLLFPLQIAGGVARRLQEEPRSGVALSDLLSHQLKAAWKPWAKITVGLLLLVGGANLLAIKAGIAPSFPAYPLQFGWSQHFAMTLPALIALPLAGLLPAVLSAAVAVVMRERALSVVAAYGLTLVAGYFLGTASREIPGTISEFLPPPGWGLWAAPGIAAGWLAYGALGGLAAALVWYLISPAARGRRAVAPSETPS